MSLSAVVGLLVAALVVRSLVVRRMALAHRERMRELELRAAPESALEDLPAYVDPEDKESLRAWRQAKTELDQAW